MIPNALDAMLEMLGPNVTQRMLEQAEAEDAKKLITSTLSLTDLRLVSSALAAYSAMLSTAIEAGVEPKGVGERFMLVRASDTRRKIEELQKLIKAGIQKAEAEAEKHAQ